MPLAAGRALATGDVQSAVITQTLADQEHVGVGGTVSLNGTLAAGPQAYQIVGILTGDGPLPEAGGRLVLMPLASAQTLFGTTGVTRVDVGVAAGTSVDEIIGELGVSIKTEPYLLQRSSDLAASLRSEMADFGSALLLVAVVVLFAGAFLIFNTLSMTVAERTREVGLLRAAGTTRSQVMGLILLQAFALGVLGSAVGVCAGVGLAALMLSWVGSSGPIALTAPALSAGSIAMALLIGVALTLAASLEPAWRAGRITPVDALRRGATGAAAGAARLRWLVVVFGVLAVAALAVWPGGQAGGSAEAASLAAGSGSGTWGPLVIYGLLLVSVLLVPLVLVPLVRVAGLPFRIFRNEERLARSSLSRDRSRTALTAGAFVVGLAMVVALATAAQDVRKIGSSWLTETIPGSELLTSIRPVALTDPIRDQLAATPGVKSVSPIGIFGVPYVSTSVNGGSTQETVVLQEAAAIVGRDYLADGRLNFISGDRYLGPQRARLGRLGDRPGVAGGRGGNPARRFAGFRDGPVADPAPRRRHRGPFDTGRVTGGDSGGLVGCADPIRGRRRRLLRGSICRRPGVDGANRSRCGGHQLRPRTHRVWIKSPAPWVTRWTASSACSMRWP